MGKNSKNIGDLGESLACGYLIKNGYKLVDKNYREKWGELDIIAINPSKIITFIEVKSLKFKENYGVDNSEDLGIIPEDNFTKRKLDQVVKLSQFYINSRPEIMKKYKGWQVDLLAVYIKEGEEDKSLIKHYENVVSNY